MQRIRFAAWILPLATFSSLAFAQQPPDDAPPVQRAPVPDRISPPKQREFSMPPFPASELEARNTGYVDVTMRVSAAGYTQEIKSVTSEPRSTAFEEATKDAVAKWRFAPGLKRCVPIEADATYRVLFEMVDGAGRVRAVPLVSKAQIPDPSHEMIARNKNEMLRTLRYPVDARRAGVQGSVYLLLKVNAASGEIESVDIASVSSSKSGFENKFSDAAMEVVRKFVFTPMPELKSPRVICVPVEFALR